MAEAERIKALGEASESRAPYPVNQPTIGTWLDAMGYDNERFRQGEAPPSMAQVWTMPGLGRKRPPTTRCSRMMEVLTDEGYTAVLGTNCEQSYERYLRVGEELRVTTRARLGRRPEEHRDGRGLLRDLAQHLVRRRRGGGDHAVPGAQVHPQGRRRDAIRPMVEPRLAVLLGRHQRPASCGSRAATPAARLRFPPGPACRAASAYDRGYVVAAGTGTVFSYVVHRHPPVPGKELPIVIALIDLDEGVRMVGEVVDVADDEIEIGMRLRVDFRRGRRRADPADLEAAHEDARGRTGRSPSGACR